MPTKRNPINYLELGVGAGTRIKKLAAHAKATGRIKRLLGLDIRSSVRAKSDLPTLTIRKGVEGEAINALSNLMASRTQAKVVNADFLFGGLRVTCGMHKEHPTPFSFRDDYIYRLLNLVNKVLVENGRLYITEYTRNIPLLEEALRNCGFVIDKKKDLTEEETPTQWGRKAFRRAEEKKDTSLKPVRIVARKANDLDS